MTKSSTVASRAGITTVTATVISSAIRFPLWQIASHSFLPPAATVAVTTPAAAVPFTIVLA